MITRSDGEPTTTEATSTSQRPRHAAMRPPLDHCPLMPTYAPPPVDVRARRGHRALGRATAGATSTSCPASPSRRSATPTRVADALAEQARHAAARVEPVRHRAGGRGRPHARPAARRRRPGLLLQLGGRGQRVRHQAGPQVGRPRPPRRGQRATARSTAAPSPPSTPPASRPSTRRSSRCPRASATSPGTTSTRSRRPSTRPWPPCCSSRCRARAA